MSKKEDGEVKDLDRNSILNRANKIKSLITQQ